MVVEDTARKYLVENCRSQVIKEGESLRIKIIINTIILRGRCDGGKEREKESR